MKKELILFGIWGIAMGGMVTILILLDLIK